MKKSCCFCGSEIKKYPQYVLNIQKYKKEDTLEQTSQELFCHEECFLKKIVDERILYLKYI